jgi:hypothetical protein
VEIKNFCVTRGGRYCPLEFAAEIDENVPLAKIVENIIEQIKLWRNEPGFENTFSSDTRANQIIVDTENQAAAFLLLREDFYIFGNMRWQEAVYGIKIQENILKGTNIDFGAGRHGPEGDTGSHDRFVLSRIGDKILHYKHGVRTEWETRPDRFGIPCTFCKKTESEIKEYDLEKIFKAQEKDS